MLPWTDRSSARDSGLPKKWLVRGRRRKLTKQITLLDGGLTGMEFQMRDAWSLSGKRSGPLKFHVDLAGLSVRFSEWILVIGERVVIEYLDCCYLRYLKTFRLCVYGLLGQTVQMTQRLEVDGVTIGTSTKRTSTKRTSTKRIELRNFS